MGCAEIRRDMKNEKKAKTATYNPTKAQLDAMVRGQIEDELVKIRQQATDDAVNTAMILLLTLHLRAFRVSFGRADCPQRFADWKGLEVNTMTIEEAIERMKHAWEQLVGKVIKLGAAIRKAFHDIFDLKEVSLELPKNTMAKRKRYHRKEKPSVQYRYIPTAKRNLPYMRRSY